MAEVELQQIGPYHVTSLLRMSPTSNFYQGKQHKKDILIQRLNIPLTTPEDKERFLFRAKQLKKLKHRNIVNILYANFDGDYGYLVMEYTITKTLHQHLAPKASIAPDEAKRYLSPIAGALHYAHLNNTVHANLSPSNLLVGDRNDILLTNFSLIPASFVPSLDDGALATPYRAPEHLRAQPTAASDQYSLAVIVYELLCERRPYNATEQKCLLMQQEQLPLPPPSSLNEAISSAVEQVIIRALACDPAERFPNIQAFADYYLSALMGFPVKSTVARMPRPIKPILSPNQSPTPHQLNNLVNGHPEASQPIAADTTQHSPHPIDTDQTTTSIPISQKTDSILPKEQIMYGYKETLFSPMHSHLVTEEAKDLRFHAERSARRKQCRLSSICTPRRYRSFIRRSISERSRSQLDCYSRPPAGWYTLTAPPRL